MTKVLDWAVDKGIFLEARRKTPVFGLGGRSGDRIISFATDWVACYLQEIHYPGGAQERDQMVTELKELGIYDQHLKADDVTSSRNFARTLTDLNDDEFQTLLNILSRFCQAPG